MGDNQLPGQALASQGVNPAAGVIVEPPKPGEASVKEENVGLDELDKTDRVLVQQLNEYSESEDKCCLCCIDYEGENEFEVTDRFGHQIMYAKEESGCCSRQYCNSLRSFEMNLTDRQGKMCIKMRRPFNCDNCCLCPCMNQSVEVECPPGVIVGRIEQKVTFISPEYDILDGGENVVFTVKAPAKCCVCCSSLCCCCGKSKQIVFKIENTEGDQVGSISKQWDGILKSVVGRADRFSIDFPNMIDPTMKAVLLGATFLIDYLHFEADPGDSTTEDNDY